MTPRVLLRVVICSSANLLGFVELPRRYADTKPSASGISRLLPGCTHDPGYNCHIIIICVTVPRLDRLFMYSPACTRVFSIICNSLSFEFQGLDCMLLPSKASVSGLGYQVCAVQCSWIRLRLYIFDTSHARDVESNKTSVPGRLGCLLTLLRTNSN